MSDGNKSNKKELAASFTPADIEAPLYQKWLLAGYFKADAKSTKPPFTIVIAPPNVTGSLHIGHALDHTLQDILISIAIAAIAGYKIIGLLLSSETASADPLNYIFSKKNFNFFIFIFLSHVNSISYQFISNFF